MGGLLAYLILSFFIANFYTLSCYKPTQIFCCHIFSEVYLSLIMVRDYRCFVICRFIVAIFIAILSLLPCDCSPCHIEH